MYFKDASVVVTGASSEIGKSIVEEFAKDGANITLISKNQEEMQKLVRKLPGYGGRFLIIKCDVRKEIQVKAAIRRVLKEFGRIDILINNAGVVKYDLFLKQSMKDINSQIETNLITPIYFLKESIPEMIKQGEGEIVNICSVSSKEALPFYATYTATKFGLYGLSESLFYELKPHNINVHVILPCSTKTNMYKDETFKGKLKRSKLLMNPKEIALEVLNSIELNKFEIIIPKHYKINFIQRAMLGEKYLELQYEKKYKQFLESSQIKEDKIIELGQVPSSLKKQLTKEQTQKYFDILKQSFSKHTINALNLLRPLKKDTENLFGEVLNKGKQLSKNLNKKVSKQIKAISKKTKKSKKLTKLKKSKAKKVKSKKLKKSKTIKQKSKEIVEKAKKIIKIN